MPTRAENIYWNECFPDALLPTIQGFMANSDTDGIMGICSLAVCNQRNVDCEAAISSILHEILQVVDEAKKMREDLEERELEFKEKGIYEVRERRIELFERGLVPLPRLDSIIVGYKRKAREIYSSLNNAGLLTIEEHDLGSSGNSVKWIGLNVMWNDIIDEIEATGNTTSVFASSLGVMLCMAINQTGTTNVIPMTRGILIADNNGGEIRYENLRDVYRNPKSLNIILEREREKIDDLKIFSSDDGRKLVLNPKVAYAVGRWQYEANRLAQTRGLGV